MRKVILFNLKLICVIVSLFYCVAGQPSNELIKFPLGIKYEISNLTINYPLRLPLILDIETKTIKVTLLGVSFNNKNQQNLMQAFTVETEIPAIGENKPTFLKINLSPGQLEQGTYQLLIDIEATVDSNNRPRHQNLSIELTLPAAKLQQPETLKINQLYLPFGTKTVGLQKLLLIENSGHQTGLENIIVKQLTLVGENNVPVDAIVSFDSPIALMPGESKEIPVHLSDALPLGTTTGTILIKSLQLAEPVTIPIEIKVRRHWGYIIFFLILGLIAGFMTRIWAKKQIDLYNARKTAQVALNALVEASLQYPDAIFNEKVKFAKQKIIKAADGGDIKNIENETTAANQELSIALSNLEQRRGEVKTLFNQLKQAEKVYKALPEEFNIVFDPSALNLIEKDILAGNIAAASDKTNAFIGDISETLDDVLGNWTSKMKVFVLRLKALSPLLLPQSIIDELDLQFSDLTAKFADSNFNENKNVEGINTTFNKLKDIRIMIQNLLWNLETLLGNTSKYIQTEFGEIDRENEPTSNKLVKKIEEFQILLRGWAESSSEKVNEIQNKIIDLKLFWKSVLISQVETFAKIEKEVRDLLDKEDYAGATQHVIKFLSASRKRDFLGPETDVALVGTPNTFQLPNFILSLESHPKFDEANSSNVKPLTTVPTLKVFTAAGSLTSFIAAKVISFVVAGFGIVAIGYVLFADKFVGTVSDLLAVFIWAYGIDLSINAFLELGKKSNNA